MNVTAKPSAFNSGFREGADMVRLHLNESPYGLPPSIVEECQRILKTGLFLYPDSACDTLRAEIAAHAGVSKEMIAVGNGVDELIMLLTLTLARNGGEVVFSESAFPGYRSAAIVAGARERAIPLVDYAVDVEGMIQAMHPPAAVAFFCNPLNPTGALLDGKDVAAIIDAADNNRVVPVFDEAYMDYVFDENKASAMQHVRAGRNVVVLRTFSKAWGLASIRIGYAVGPAHIVREVWQNRNALPFNINRIAQAILPEVLRQKDYVADIRQKNAAVREAFCKKLMNLGINYRKSETNFVMVSAHGNSTDLTAKLSDKYDILVRDLELFGIPGWLRISIGMEEDLNRLCRALDAEIPICVRQRAADDDRVHWKHEVTMQESMTSSQIFNGFAASHAIQALEELGAWNVLASGPCDPIALAADLEVSEHILLGLLRAVTLVGLLDWRDGRFSLTDNGCEILAQIGYFTWGVGGYGGLLQDLSENALQSRIQGAGICVSNGALIAKGAGHVGARSMLPVEHGVVKNLIFSKVADIGCGDGTRLIRLLRQNPDAAAIGIDINADACRSAREMVERAGLNDRVQVIHGDVLQVLDAPELHGVDLVCCFLMMHDLFAAAQDPTSAILALRNAFPDATEFLFADTVRQDWDMPGKLPMFSLQFELVHALTKTSLHSLQTYKDAFTESGLHLKQLYPFGAPSTWLFHLSIHE